MFLKILKIITKGVILQWQSTTTSKFILWGQLKSIWFITAIRLRFTALEIFFQANIKPSLPSRSAVSITCEYLWIVQQSLNFWSVWSDPFPKTNTPQEFVSRDSDILPFLIADSSQHQGVRTCWSKYEMLASFPVLHLPNLSGRKRLKTTPTPQKICWSVSPAKGAWDQQILQEAGGSCLCRSGRTWTGPPCPGGRAPVRKRRNNFDNYI